MRRCRSCNIPLWIAWLMLAAPWQRRLVDFREAADCVDLLSDKHPL